MRPLLLPLATLTLALTHADAATLSASNVGLALSYDEAGHVFTLTDRASGRIVVTEGRLEGDSVAAAAATATHPLFGPGEQVVVKQADGGTVALSLFRDLPFLIIETIRKNNTSAEIDVQKARPATLLLDLAKPATALRTMGTGGLLPVDKNPGSYFFLTVADPSTRNGVVAGWLTSDRGSGTFFSAVRGERAEITAQLEHGHLLIPPGGSAKLDTFVAGYFPDARIGQEHFADAVKRQYDIRLRPPVATYCSWYAEGPDHGRAGTPATTVELSRFIAEKLKPFGLGVIQLDDGWQDGPSIGGPATEFDRVSPTLHYKDGIAPVAAELEKDGVTLGLWWLPFGRNHMQPEYKDRQDWFVKKPDGTPLRQHSFGGTCLDSTVPAVQQHLKDLAAAIRSWGVKYYKMDGISVGAGLDHVYINDGYKNDNLSNCLPLHDRTKTNIEAMRMGLKIIREGAGDDVFFSGCAATQNMRTYAGTIGLVDSMRVGPDFNHDGEGIRSGPLRGSRMYFMHGRVWWNDPDPSKVRTSTAGSSGDNSIAGAVSLDQARLTTSWVSLSGQFFLLSDWLPYLPEARLEVLRRTLAHHDATARPVDYFDNALANTWLVTDARDGVRRDVIGVFNFYNQPLAIDHDCAWMGLDPAKTYHAFDFWANRPLAQVKGRFAATVPPTACQVVAVREDTGHPVVVSTSRHVTQGILDLSEERWDPATMTLSGTSALIANDPYELRIAGIHDDLRALIPVNISATINGAASNVLERLSTAADLVRLTLRAETSTDVHWTIRFAPASPGLLSSHLEEQSVTAALGPVPPAPDIRLTDLKPESVTVGWGQLTRGRSVAGGPLLLGGQTYADGIGLHANAEVVYARPADAKRFVAVVGLDDSQQTDPRASIQCSVSALNAAGVKTRLGLTPVMSSGKTGLWHLDLPLPPDCVKIVLGVTDADDGINCDHADWVNAGFKR